MKANYHTHTYRCGHAGGSDEQFVEAAIDAGLELLGFSDHLPMPASLQAPDRMLLSEFPEYLASINGLKEKYRQQIEIKVALECEWLPQEQDFLWDLKKQCDYFLFGNHERLVPRQQYDYTRYADDRAIEAYCRESKEALESGLFLYFAHPDYFMFGRRSFNEACRQAAHYLAKLCADLAVPMEINLSGFVKSHYIDGKYQPPYPFPEFWQIVAQYPVKVIYGCDAHYPIQLFRADMIEAVNAHLGNLTLDIVDRLADL